MIEGIGEERGEEDGGMVAGSRQFAARGKAGRGEGCISAMMRGTA